MQAQWRSPHSREPSPLHSQGVMQVVTTDGDHDEVGLANKNAAEHAPAGVMKAQRLVWGTNAAKCGYKLMQLCLTR